MRKILLLILIAVCGQLFAQQKPPVQKPKFFPMKKENEWVYYTSTFEPFSEGNPKRSYPLAKRDTVYLHIGDTITVNKKKYFYLLNFAKPVKLVRFDKYTGLYYSKEVLEGDKKFGPEKLFLKNSLKVNTTWNSANTKASFKVVSFAKDTIIQGTGYKNVYEVDEKVMNTKVNKMLTIKHWYAENIGEIATYLPYPISNAIGDLKLQLSDYPMAK